MENTFKNWILDYCMSAHRRFYKKEKIRFLQHIEQDFHKMGYTTSILSPEGSKGKAINLLIGDVKTAKNIIIASYDTPVKNFGLYTYRPFDLRYRKIWYMALTIVPFILIALLCFYFSISFLRLEWLKGVFHIQDIFTLILYLLGILILIHYAKGIPNARNFNRNSASLIAILHLAQSLDIQKRHTTAFVLTDFGCMNHMGDQMLKAYLKNYQKQHFIILDCIGRKETTAVCYSKSFRELVKHLDKQIVHCELNDTYNNIAHLYPNTLVISSGTLKNDTLTCKYVNTRKDINIDPEQLLYVAKEIRKLL